jgi:hypothetical protein
MNSTFHTELKRFIDSHDNENANRVIMCEIGRSLAKNKDDFREVIESSNIVVPKNAGEIQLVDAFCKNAPSNRKLLLGASFLINHNNKQVGFDGEETIDDKAVKDTYKTMYQYFDCSNFDDTSDVVTQDFYSVDGEYYNAGGGAVGALVIAIAMALGEGAKLGTAITDAKSKRKERKYTVSDNLAKQREARSQVLKALIEKKSAEEKAKSGKSKTMIIVLSVVGVLIVGGLVIFAMKNRRG